MAVFNIEESRKRSELMRKALAGDQISYETLLREIGQMLKKYVAKRVEQAESREDIVQQVLLRVHLYRSSFSGTDSFDAWLYVIARNCFYDHLRIKLREDEEPFAADQEVGTAPAQETTLAAKEALQRLSPEAMRALVLTKQEGLDNETAAAREGISESAFKVRVHRAMKVLRESWSDEK